MSRLFSRRAFLRSTAGGAMALPLLSAPRRARAAEEFPVRFIVVYQPNGTRKELWSPEGSETEFSLPLLLSPLERHKHRLVLFDGVDNAAAQAGPGGPHQRGMAALLTGQVIQEGDFVGGDGRRAGWGNGISVDQYLVERLNPPTQFGSLELGVNVRENMPRGRIVYRGPGQPVPPENDPRLAYNRIFSMVSRDREDMNRIQLQRRSVLDLVKGDFTRLNRVLATPDRQKLEQHLDSLRSLERRLGIVGSAMPGCELPEEPGQMEVLGEDQIAEIARLQADLLVHAMACDLTRIGSIQHSTAVNHIRFTFMDIDDRDGHSLSHAGDSNMPMQDKWIRMLTWYSQQFAYLLDRLDSVPEGDGTMLDNTVILWCNELSRGNTHNLNDIPFVLAGGAGGALRTGRHLKYDGQPHNNLLVSVLNAMGVEEDTFGNPEYCTGALSGVI